jgi:hypothetical protein
MPSSKSENSSLLAEGRKEVIYITTRTLQEVTFPEYPSLRNTLRKNSIPKELKP